MMLNNKVVLYLLFASLSVLGMQQPGMMLDQFDLALMQRNGGMVADLLWDSTEKPGVCRNYLEKVVLQDSIMQNQVAQLLLRRHTDGPPLRLFDDLQRSILMNLDETHQRGGLHFVRYGRYVVGLHGASTADLYLWDLDANLKLIAGPIAKVRTAEAVLLSHLCKEAHPAPYLVLPDERAIIYSTAKEIWRYDLMTHETKFLANVPDKFRVIKLYKHHAMVVGLPIERPYRMQFLYFDNPGRSIDLSDEYVSAISSDGKFALVSNMFSSVTGPQKKLMRVDSEEMMEIMLPPNTRCWQAKFSPDGQYIISTTFNGYISIMRLSDGAGEVIQPANPLVQGWPDLFMPSDGVLVAAYNNQGQVQIMVIDFSEQVHKGINIIMQDSCSSFKISSDRRWLVYSKDNAIYGFDLQEKKTEYNLDCGFPIAIESISSHGKYLALKIQERKSVADLLVYNIQGNKLCMRMPFEQNSAQIHFHEKNEQYYSIRFGAQSEFPLQEASVYNAETGQEIGRFKSVIGTIFMCVHELAQEDCIKRYNSDNLAENYIIFDSAQRCFAYIDIDELIDLDKTITSMGIKHALLLSLKCNMSNMAEHALGRVSRIGPLANNGKIDSLLCSDINRIFCCENCMRMLGASSAEESLVEDGCCAEPAPKRRKLCTVPQQWHNNINIGGPAISEGDWEQLRRGAQGENSAIEKFDIYLDQYLSLPRDIQQLITLSNFQIFRWYLCVKNEMRQLGLGQPSQEPAWHYIVFKSCLAWLPILSSSLEQQLHQIGSNNISC